MINQSVMKNLITTASFAFVMTVVSNISNAQSLLGTWQLVKQSNCIESELGTSDTEKELIADMKSQSGPAAL